MYIKFYRYALQASATSLVRNLCCAFAMFSFVGNPVFAAISQSPVFLNTPPDPNIMFTLDDSGSMTWEVLPGDTFVNGRRVECLFRSPLPDIYGYNGTYNNCVDTDTNNIYNRFFRSSSGNPIYYDPNIRYEPWIDAAGTAMAASSFTAAPVNPGIPAKGSLDLSVNQVAGTRDMLSSAGTWSSVAAPSFRMAIFYIRHTGTSVPGDISTRGVVANYDEYDLAAGTKNGVSFGASMPYTKSAARTDCPAANCTLAQERANYANWFTYYRSRVSAVRAGIGRAFQSLGANRRVGFSTINWGPNTTEISGLTINGLVLGVRPFTGTDKTNFYNQVYSVGIEGTTPLRVATYDVGRYFAIKDSRGPWGATPGTASAAAMHACRKNFHILATDGFWNDSNPIPTGAGSAPKLVSYEGTANDILLTGRTTNVDDADSEPYKDGYSATLADVARMMYEIDLRPDMPNLPTGATLATRTNKRMSTFTVSIGLAGSPSYAVTGSPLTPYVPSVSQPALNLRLENPAKQIVWPDPAASSIAKIDDLFHAAVNSNGEFYVASNPEQFRQSLVDAISRIDQQTEESAPFSSPQSSSAPGAMILASSFTSNIWTGSFYGYTFGANAQVNTTPVWEAHSKLNATYGGANNATNVPNRKVFTHSGGATGSSGINFNTTDLSSANITTIGGANVVNYIRGDKSNEKSNGGSFRNRTSLLGDIVNSEAIVPVPVPSCKTWRGYGHNGATAGTPANGHGGAYTTFLSGLDNALRTTAFVGANDGMLHAFKTTSSSGTSCIGEYDSANAAHVAAGGVELFSYVPTQVYPNLNQLTNLAYTHRYFVDGVMTSGDAFYPNNSSGSWKNLLVSSLGGGGKGVFALDLTSLSAVNQSQLVRWEYKGSGDNDLGFIRGNAQIGRLQDGTSVAVFGNGYDSPSGKAYLYVVNAEDGALIAKLPLDATAAAADGTASPNGLSEPELHMIDRKIVAVYAGDLKGNLWKFVFKDPVSSANDIANTGTVQTSPTGFRMITAFDEQGNRQPITTKPTITYGYVKNGTANPEHLVVVFGTGKFYEASDYLSTQLQTIYGIYDTGQTASINWSGSNRPTYSAIASNSGVETTTGSDKLVYQKRTLESTTTTVTGSGSSYTTTVTTTNAAGASTTLPSTTSTSAIPGTTKTNALTKYAVDLASHKGWMIDLVVPDPNNPTLLNKKGERVFIDSKLSGFGFSAGSSNLLLPVASSLIDTDPCGGGGVSYISLLDPMSGSLAPVTKIDSNRNGVVDGSDITQAVLRVDGLVTGYTVNATSQNGTTEYHGESSNAGGYEQPKNFFTPGNTPSICGSGGNPALVAGTTQGFSPTILKNSKACAPSWRVIQ